MVEAEEISDSEDMATDDTAAKARQAAEARRKKILEQAESRMGLVEGTYSKHATATTADAAATEEEGDSAAPAAVTKSVSKAQKLAAMRRRRFKGKTSSSTSSATTTAKEEVSPAATTDDTAEAADPKEKSAAEESPVVVENSDKAKESEAEKTENNKPSQEPEPQPDVCPAPAADAAKSTAISTEEDTETKKKYLGVAKMRRRMVKEKAAAAAQNEATTLEKSNTATKSTTAMSSKRRPRKKKTTSLLPIVMHAVTVLLLFLVGLDVGLQQQEHQHRSLVTVHSELAPRQMGGLKLLTSFMGGASSDVEKEEEKKQQPKMPALKSIEPDEWQAQAAAAAAAEDLDEFADARQEEEQQEPNIDPLFKIDLDKMTEGPGLLMMLARQAVWMHRRFLFVFYYGPRSFFRNLVDWLASLSTTPPVLCLAALVLRQFVGKLVLGAHLPDKVMDDDNGGGSKELGGGKDIMSMAKGFVSGILLKTFPNAVSLYDAWMHLRADMYVLLCGLFFGLAWSHNAAAGSPYGISSDTSDGGQAQQEPLAGGGHSDEL